MGITWEVINMAKWTQEMFVEFVSDSCNGEFEVRGQYEGNEIPVLMYHENCGREFTVRPNNFKRRRTCSLCSGKLKKTTPQFKREVKSLVGDEYIVLGQYKTAKENILIKHETCKSKYEVTPDDFLNGGTRCPICAGNRKRTNKQFEKMIKEITASEYEFIGEYVNSKTPTTFIHVSCGTVFEKKPEYFTLDELRCPKCGLERRSGENHYKYNPNLTDEEREKRDMHNGMIRKWRQKVFERDNYTCQICHKHGHVLNAHHIMSWDKYEDERFILKNGITLCEDCHKDFHSKFGYGNNNTQQFKTYVASF